MKKKIGIQILKVMMVFVLFVGIFSIVYKTFFPHSGSGGSIPYMDIDDLILYSDTIVIGKFNFLPSIRWNTPSGYLSPFTPSETIVRERLFMYTEQTLQAGQILKPDPIEREILVRSFGEITVGYFIAPFTIEVVYQPGQKYLLFLKYHTDQVKDGTPGFYSASGSMQGIYKINNGMAVSFDNEQPLDELISYIQNSRLSKVHLPDTPESRKIMQQINTAYKIENKCIFDYAELSSVYANDPRFPVGGDKLEFIRMVTDNPSLETAGYLDYKAVYYPWWLEGKRRWEGIYEKAKSENREITEDERKDFLESKWGSYHGGSCNAVGKLEARFVSIWIENDVATVVYGIGTRATEAILVLVDGDWFITQETDI